MNTPAIDTILSAAKSSGLHVNRIAPGTKVVLDQVRSFGALPDDYLEFLAKHGAYDFFKILDWRNANEHWWFGVGHATEVAHYTDGVFFAFGYRFTLGYQYFKFLPEKGRFSPHVYGGRGSGLGVYADDFSSWLQLCVRWSYKRIPKKLWVSEFGLERLKSANQSSEPTSGLRPAAAHL